VRYRQLGNSGLVVSVVGVGCNNFGGRIGAEATTAVVEAALDLGITLFDTADIYGSPHGTSEELLGRALGSRRDDAIVATKFGMDMQGVNGQDWGVRGSRRYLRTAVEASLRRLRTDRIDLLQMHEPDPRTPIDETLGALDDLVHAGKVLYVGNSNFAGWQVVEAELTARAAGTHRFVSSQPKYSLLDRSAEAELIPACLQFGLGVLPFFPLERGLLTGKYSRGQAPPAGSRLSRDGFADALAHAPWDRIEALEEFARSRGLSLLDVAIGGLAAKPAVASVIAGATTPEQIAANAKAGEWEPSPAEAQALDGITAR
jgi:aryl-alcohol dehydrogenase-like predicted oxidoreductase